MPLDRKNGVRDTQTLCFGSDIMRNKAVFKILSAAFAAFMCFCAVSPKIAAQTYSFVTTVYNEANGLPTGEANDVIQTSDGYVWIGSYGGLIRYDGTSFRNYSMESGGLASSSVRALYEDSKGRLWVGTNDAGVYLLENDVFTHVESPDSAFLCIRDFCEGDIDGESVVYCASNSGMAKISDNKLIPFETDGLFGETVYSCGIDSLGRLWGAMNSGKCVLIDIADEDPACAFITSEELSCEYDIYCLASDKYGNIYLGTEGNDIIKISFSSAESANSGELNEEKITRFTFDSVSTHNKIRISDDNDILVCGLIGFGIVSQSDDNKITEFRSDSDKAASVNSAAKDYEGNYWLASSSYGVIKYTNGCFTSPNYEMGLDDTSINSVTISGGSYYIGTSGGLLIYNSDLSRVENDFTALLDGVQVRHTMTDKSGAVWAASYSGTAAVTRYDPATGETLIFSSKNGLVSDNARVIFEMSDGSVAVGTSRGISVISDGKVTKSYSAEDGLSVQQILCFCETNDGTLLAGSDGGGIYSIKDGVIAEHSFSEGLEEGVVLRITANSSEQDAYFVSAGSSLYYWSEGKFTKLSNLKKGAGSIFDLYDKGEELWIFQNSGIFAVNKERLLAGESDEPQVYGLNYGLSGSLNANTWHFADENGNITLSTRNGISVFSFQEPEYQLPKLIINEIRIDDATVEHPTAANIDSGTQRITLDYAALSFTDTTNICMSYILEGFDKQETLISGEKSGSISYTNIPGGNYIFRLKIFDPKNPDVFAETEIAVNKDKHIYEYNVFWAILALLLVAATALIVYFTYRIRLRALKARRDELHSIVEQALLTIAETIDAKDKYTKGHSVRVANYSKELARRMGMSEEKQENIYYIALLHDIGKIGIPNTILNKPDKLTPEEFEIVRMHPTTGGAILKNFTALEGIADGAKYHHERYDGTGYNEGLKGEEIPLVARIIGVADSYDTMSSHRCYRRAIPSEEIVKELENGAGTQFDPKIVPFMIDMIKDGFAKNMNKD